MSKCSRIWWDTKLSFLMFGSDAFEGTLTTVRTSRSFVFLQLYVQSLVVFSVLQSFCLSDCVHLCWTFSVCMLTVCMLAIPTWWNGECVAGEKQRKPAKRQKKKETLPFLPLRRPSFFHLRHIHLTQQQLICQEGYMKRFIVNELKGKHCDLLFECASKWLL